MKLIRKPGELSNVLEIFIQDSTQSDGRGLTGLVFNSAGLTCYYKRNKGTAAVVVALADITTLGTFVSGGFEQVDATNMPGVYEFDPPDAALAVGAESVVFLLKGATNMAPLVLEVDLNGQVNTVAINGGLLDGYNATLKLKQLDIENDAGTALRAASTGGNGHGVAASGNGSGEGLSTTGGATGHGIQAIGGATSGDGINAIATAGDGDGIEAIGTGTGSGLRAVGPGTGNGITAQGGAISGAGILGSAQNNGHGIAASGGPVGGDGLNILGAAGNGISSQGAGGGGHGLVTFAGTGGSGAKFNGGVDGHGFEAVGNGVGDGVNATAGATGQGAEFVGGATSGDGLKARAPTSGTGLNAIGSGSGHGIGATGGATGTGVIAVGGSTSGDAMRLLAIAGDSHGLHATGNNGGVGLLALGGNTGDGIQALAGGPAGVGLLAIGNGTGPAIKALGGGDAPGIDAQGGGSSGSGFRATANGPGGHGMELAGNDTGSGLNAIGGTNGHGVKALGGGTSGDGVNTEAPASGHGMSLKGAGDNKHGLLATGAVGAGVNDGINGVAGAGGVSVRDVSNKLGGFTGTGTNTVLGFLSAMARKDIAAPSDIGGTFDPATDALEALADSSPNISIHSGTAQGPGTGTNQIQFDVGASATDGAYDPALVVITGGTGAGQSRLILQYAGATRTATVDRDWKVNPDATSEFQVLSDAGREHVNEGLAQGGTNSTITLNLNASVADDAYNGQLAFLRSGTGADQVALITDYNGTTKVATIRTALPTGQWSLNPNTTTGYVILPFSLAYVVGYLKSAIASDLAVSEPGAMFSWPADPLSIAAHLGALTGNPNIDHGAGDSPANTKEIRNRADNATLLSAPLSSSTLNARRGNYTP